MRTGIATFTLDYGKCPKWLFDRMVLLGREMTNAIILEYGPKEFIKRLADPVWFQALGTVLAFDWNSSGLTTILTAALKEAIRGRERDFGIFICGGKGKTSRKTPEQIKDWGYKIGFDDKQTNALVYNSRMSAKVDSALVQDGFQIYHHSFFFTKDGAWTVIQQGMNETTAKARRYHWHSENFKLILPEGRSFVCEPHQAIISQAVVKNPLNLTAKESEKTRQISTEMVQNGVKTLLKDIELLEKYASPYSQSLELKLRSGNANVGSPTTDIVKLVNLEDKEFKWHPVALEDFKNSRYLKKIISKIADQKPKDYEKLLSLEGVGPKTMRALALVAEIIYGAKPSYQDPARYSFAHGGKDATPYPVDRQTYDQTISAMKYFVAKTKLNFSEKQKIIHQLEQELHNKAQVLSQKRKSIKDKIEKECV
ncbi:MAG: DUF763 domain-containing protein, partial [Candidatus Paceibacteria bacterium]